MKSGWINVNSFLSVFENEELLKSYLKVNRLSSISEEELKCCNSFFMQLKPFLSSKQMFAYLLDQTVEDGFREQFDILRFAKDSILNVELKSQYPQDGLNGIYDQLDRHTYLLNTLEKNVFAYTFVLNTNELFKIDQGKLVKIDFREVANNIEEEYIEENSLKLIDASTILISPYSEPDKFIKSRYFLNHRQKEIRNLILRNNRGKFSISGGAGTGKSLVLFDLAKEFNKNQSILYIFVANIRDSSELSAKYGFLFKSISEIKKWTIDDYNRFDVILIDEAQRLTRDQYDVFINSTATIIFSVDKEQVLKHNEKSEDIQALLDANPNVENHKLTDRVRSDKSLSTFIKKLFDLKARHLEPMEFPKVNVVYFSNVCDAREFIRDCEKVDNYCCIEIAEYTTVASRVKKRNQILSDSENGFTVIGREYDNVLIPIDERVYYDEDAKLIAVTYEYYPYLEINNLFEGITRVKQNLLFVVINNTVMFKTIQEIITWYDDTKNN